MSNETLSRCKHFFREGADVRLIAPIAPDEHTSIQWFNNGKKIVGADAPIITLTNFSTEGVFHFETIHHDENEEPEVSEKITVRKLGVTEKGFCPPHQLIVELESFDEAAQEEIAELKRLLKVNSDTRTCPGKFNFIQLWEWDPEDHQGFQEARRILSDETSKEAIVNDLVEAMLSHGDKAGEIDHLLQSKLQEMKRKIHLKEKHVKKTEDNFLRPLSFVEHGDHSTGKPHLHDPDFPGTLDVHFGDSTSRELPPVNKFPGIDKQSVVERSPEKRTVLIAIVDSGIAYRPESDHTDPILSSIKHKRILNKEDIFGYNFVDDNQLPFDDNGHGTEIAHIILFGKGTTKNDRVKILPIKTHNQYGIGMLFDCISGIFYAIEKQADVINISWGSGGDQTYFLEKAIEAAEKEGVLIIASAGNAGLNNDEVNHYPSNFSRKKGGKNNVIAVGALNKEGTEFLKFDDSQADPNNPYHVHGSSYGEDTVQIATIGEGYKSIYPRYMQGTSYATAKVTHSLGKFLLDHEQAGTAAEKKQNFLEMKTLKKPVVVRLNSNSKTVHVHDNLGLHTHDGTEDHDHDHIGTDHGTEPEAGDPTMGITRGIGSLPGQQSPDSDHLPTDVHRLVDDLDHDDSKPEA
ncbi:S8 family serine peptidase [Flavilitoribacter nigricans]|uniref:Peptidase S8/S53 domain-containing protein n=1 Tax=Flavilitoribacter nigricans (strain ATCC 23147 / DSM 23189 / NBRC 102662 / NCIMB 1420 / SS-2) TaxID=1122177 RepID=A0A2D0MX18_FLAN2|nr:S8 family serine peptidase [Flavilitoribacter nigricans]PHN00676.1 hypothetical protein CRP01_40975 [Flavilitoribacter nigricans DSM 23189 = NBRC 102662]